MTISEVSTLAPTDPEFIAVFDNFAFQRGPTATPASTSAPA